MMNFQELVQALNTFWGRQGAVLQQPYDLEVGAGTMHPDTFFRVLGPEPWRGAYCSPSRRPVDGRYGENPFRVYKHYQFQVILKAAPLEIQDLDIASLASFGVNVSEHDIRFEEDNWESPTLGAAGVGWQVMLDGMEISQFTYFQQAGGLELTPISAELTYGTERIAMFLNEVEDVFDLSWNSSCSYGDIRREEEVQFSRFSFEEADLDLHQRLFEQYETEANRLIAKGLYLPAYDFCLKCSHTFNILDARGAISTTERPGFIGRVRRIACQCAELYIESRKAAGFPLQHGVLETTP
jgi:glycyl-tRNA synthetase alpha chain